MATDNAQTPARTQSWTVGELLSWTTDRFRQVGIDEARVDAEHLLALALGCKRFDLYVQHARLLGEAERAPFRELVKRRLAREPVAYIAGTRGFHALDLDLAVDRRVLIPRPETEHLVDWLLEELPGRRRPAPPVDDLDEASDAEASEGDAAEASVELEPASVEPEAPAEPTPPVHVLDVGTGSGAIALAVKRARPDAVVAAVDLSDDALAVARANAERCGLEIAFRRGDLTRGVPLPAGGFQAIAANLPYIPSRDLAGLQPEVRDFEPRMALDGGADGLDLVRRLVDECARPGVLAPGGRLYLEIGVHQAPAVIELLRARGYAEVSARRDYGGIDRVIAATAPAR
ncbi:MAG: peptide chain release factor N(5)-glutamine methyltransferase [Myxococcales bacterium]|nr:peptide chain release factor N(5)-glutamine methyltransferase [Myxococcales bacterium]MCB9704527.1 peptide chain release factor N(5)-glutamine methyltransferase [Myxococcales bacterium]